MKRSLITPMMMKRLFITTMMTMMKMLVAAVLAQLIDPPEDEGELSDGLQRSFVSPLRYR